MVSFAGQLGLSGPQQEVEKGGSREADREDDKQQRVLRWGWGAALRSLNSAFPWTTGAAPAFQLMRGTVSWPFMKR